MSLVSSINMAQQALLANQTALTTVSNNIANVDTEGYSKLRVSFSSSALLTSSSSPLSIANSLDGVRLTDIQRSANFGMEKYYWQENSQSSYIEQYAKSGSMIENIVNELDGTGLSSALNTFYDAADTLANNPSDLTSRQNYVSAADNLCTVFNNTSSDLKYIQESLVGTGASVNPSQLGDSISNVNDLIDQLAAVNKNIIKTSSAGNALPALMDQRDALVEKLSDYIPVNVVENQDNTVSVSLGKYKLVNGTEIKSYFEASNSLDADGHTVTTMSLVDTEGNPKYANVNSHINSGSIGAILDVCSTDDKKFNINGVMDFVDKLAGQFATTLNSLQLNADASGTPLCIDRTSRTLINAVDPIFVSKDTLNPTIKASNISINEDILENPYLIAAARTDTTAATYSDTQIGNNSNMTKVLAMRSSTYGTLDNMTMESYLSSKASKVGSAVEDLNTSVDTQKAVVSAVKSRLEAETGVNLDEELVDLMKYQRAYQAAARVFSVCNELLDNLLKMG